jgi:hypothetical protein
MRHERRTNLLHLAFRRIAAKHCSLSALPLSHASARRTLDSTAGIELPPFSAQLPPATLFVLCASTTPLARSVLSLTQKQSYRACNHKLALRRGNERSKVKGFSGDKCLSMVLLAAACCIGAMRRLQRRRLKLARAANSNSSHSLTQQAAYSAERQC